MTAHHATILWTVPVRGYRAFMAKRFDLGPDGLAKMLPYDKAAKFFSAESVALDGIHGLHRLLLRLEGDPHACLIRAEPVEGVDRNRLRRVLAGKAEGTMAEVPRHWVMLDGDGLTIDLPPGCCVLSDPAEVARAVVDNLAARAPELEGVSAIVQFSARAGLHEAGQAAEAAGLPNIWAKVAEPGLRVHVWYWLRTPRGQADLKRWCAKVAAAGLKLDERTANTVQAHYVAAPPFLGGLRDPLAGRRTVFVQGSDDAGDLDIPPEPPPPRPGTRGTGKAGRGFNALLADIGRHGEGDFRDPILRAVCSYIATNGPDAFDPEGLKGRIRARVGAVDPGRLAKDYAGDAELDRMIAWAEAQERAKREAERAASVVPPTYPDRGIPLAEAERQACGAVRSFAERLGTTTALAMLLRMTVGGGKSFAAIAVAAYLLAKARLACDDPTAALYYAVPRLDLGEEIRQRIADANPGLEVVIWRGMDQPDPADPARKMCLDPELTQQARAHGLSSSVACGACPLRGACAYQGQKKRVKRPDIVILAHQMMFHRKPEALPRAAAVVMDEAWWNAGLVGRDDRRPVTMLLSALDERRIGGLKGWAADRLLFLRGQMRLAFDGWADMPAMPDGKVMRSHLEALHLTAEAMQEWHALEWRTHHEPKLEPGMDREEILARMAEADTTGFHRGRVRLAKFMQHLLEGTDARCVGAERQGDAVRFEWREGFREWLINAPKLVLDATTHPLLLRQWLPDLEVVDIEAQAPQQHVVQVADREFGRSAFLGKRGQGNVRRLADLAVVELAKADGPVLVVAQQAVEGLLRAEMVRRFDGEMPARLHLAHHGALTGMNRWADAATVIVAGRPAMDRLATERTAEILGAGAVQAVCQDDTRFPAAEGGIRMADGTGHRVQHPHHPDPLAEAVRWSVTEGAVIQAIGRGRGVRRKVRVVVLGSTPLPLTVNEVLTWDEAAPLRVVVAAAEAALAGTALPLAPADMAMARPDLWPSGEAAKKDLARGGKRGHSPISADYGTCCDPLFLLLGNCPLLACARYRKPDARRWSLALVPPEHGRAALEQVLGCTLAAFEIVAPEPAQAEREAPAPTPTPTPPVGMAAAPPSRPDRAAGWAARHPDDAPRSPPWPPSPAGPDPGGGAHHHRGPLHQPER